MDNKLPRLIFIVYGLRLKQRLWFDLGFVLGTPISQLSSAVEKTPLITSS